MTKLITGASLAVAVTVVFALTGMPAWAYLLPAAMVAVDAALIFRARRIDTARH